ncbi:MAG TPA: carboxypeptidase regulatory-like domain-containing protein, partial [Ilumatobacteraceae bacterium]|nr:carboxypeptidase regulatory-like domain-containing protein [Ilumatobacteraceae bacterium]
QLDINATYTITASADGYLTQTRVVTPQTNVGNIDFAMVRTTGALTGNTVSSAFGDLAGVGIMVTGSDLVFGSTSAAAPSAGWFRLDEIPPGDYLITFTRYDHADVSQRVVVEAGVTLDLGEIAMEYRQRPPLTETGRLVVAVQNSANVPLGGATVALLKISDGTVVRTITDTVGTETSFAFDNVPIGTYTLRVSHGSYRTQSRRISMGLSARTETFVLLQKGQVSGRVVNAVRVRAAGALGDPQLNNYEIKIYRLNLDGSRSLPELERIVVPSTATPDGDGNILFQSQPTSLTDGTYEVELSVRPVGFRRQPDQHIDPDDATSVMRFTIGDTDEGSLRLNDIRVDPYPSLTGRVLEPVTAANPFKPLANATVRLTCTGQPGVATATTDAFGVYTFNRRTIDEQTLLGDCSARLSASEFRQADIDQQRRLQQRQDRQHGDRPRACADRWIDDLARPHHRRSRADPRRRCVQQRQRVGRLLRCRRPDHGHHRGAGRSQLPPAEPTRSPLRHRHRRNQHRWHVGHLRPAVRPGRLPLRRRQQVHLGHRHGHHHRRWTLGQRHRAGRHRHRSVHRRHRRAAHPQSGHDRRRGLGRHG